MKFLQDFYLIILVFFSQLAKKVILAHIYTKHSLKMTCLINFSHKIRFITEKINTKIYRKYYCGSYEVQIKHGENRWILI